MKQITGLAHIGIRVKDLAVTRDFYEKIGFEFIAGPVGPEPVAIMTHPSGVLLNFILNGDDETPKNLLMDVPEKHAGYTHMALAVNNLEDVMATLKKLDIPLSGGPIDTGMGSTLIFIRDPDLNVIEFNHSS